MFFQFRQAGADGRILVICQEKEASTVDVVWHHRFDKEFAGDDWQSYQKAIAPQQNYIGKDRTQRIERVNLSFRTHLKRLHRRGIGFSKSEEMAMQ